MDNRNMQDSPEELESTTPPEEITEELTLEEAVSDSAQDSDEEAGKSSMGITGDLDLESIIEEFRIGSGEEAPEADDSQEEANTPSIGDTIRIDLSALSRLTAQVEAIPTEEFAPPPAPPEKAEPFSDQWEPEYEQPMGEYIPPQPIVFQPQSRFRELKKKLVAGPERQYYMLAEKGTGKLQVLLFFSLLVSLICIGAAVLYHLGMVQENRMKLMIFSQLLCMLLSALLGSHQLIEGLADLIRGRFSLNTLLIFSFILCCADGFLCLKDAARVPCCAAFSLLTVFSLFDTLHRRRTEMSQMDVLRKATDLTSLRPGTEKLEGRKVMLRDKGQVEDFMDSYHIRSVPEKVRSFYAMFALAAAIGVGVTGTILHGLSQGLRVAAITLLAAVPASFFVCLSRPADILQKRFHKLGTLLCGWRGICTTKGSLAFSVSHQDLFPTGSVKMNGVKFFGSRDPDEVVAYSTALVVSSQNGLAPLFEQVLESRNCHHLTAQNIEVYDGGIGGTVRGEEVLVGSLSFLKQMGVELPEGVRINQAVCVAIEGSLCGMFAIHYEKTRRSAMGLGTLCSYRKLKTVVCDGDFLLTPEFLQRRFGINPNRVSFASPDLRTTLAQMEPDEQSPAAVLSTQHDLASLAFGITGARALYKSCILGLSVHMAGGLIGIGIMLTLTLIGALNLLTPINVILFQLIWSIPGLLLTEWSRLI